jgi:hypothetical protein
LGQELRLNNNGAQPMIDEKNIHDVAAYVKQSLNSCGAIKSYTYPMVGDRFNILTTTIDDIEGYTLFVTTNYPSGIIFLYLSDSEINPAFHLLSCLEKSVISGMDVSSEKVISISDQYLNKKDFSGLLFLEPEDLEVYGLISSDAQIGGTEFKVLCVMPLKSYEFKKFQNQGMKAIIDMFSREDRDFLSVN